MVAMRYGVVLLAAVVVQHPLRVAAVDHSAEPQAATELTVLPGFRAERLLSVPRDYASWINMTFDPQGRILVSDQGNRMHRITPAPLGEVGSQTVVETLDLGVGGAHGLVYALQSLYVVTGGSFPESGVFRLRDTDGRGRFSAPERILNIPGHGEHGPHGIVWGPRGEWLYVIAGNGSGLPSGITRDHVAHIRSTERVSVPKPQGWVIRISADGRQRELFCQGLRNAYDLAFHPAGELFTFDSDNEGFYGMPWYRPTNIYHLVSGADYGWRQSPANLRSTDPDNVPPVKEIGPGSPTGVVFGTQTNFPNRYRRALFACDWSYGRIYAVDLEPKGASWTAQWQFFASGRPLPVTDIAAGPDGALYFVTGGRSTQSHLYRISWIEKPTSAADRNRATRRPAIHAQAMHTRRSLEAFNGAVSADAVSTAWPFLGSKDRAVRYAARTAIEQQPVDTWRARVFTESDPQSVIEALVAIARQGHVRLRSRILST
ncbi:MAG: PQQ-dependent sugar dehydrogenase, partial [Planctomycetaceae bacterium]